MSGTSVSDYDSDEWEETVSCLPPAVVPNPRQKTIHTIELPKLVRNDLEKIPETLEMLNLVDNGKKKDLYRCEPASKQYPGCHSSALCNLKTYLLQICLFNSAPNRDGVFVFVPMRVPDFKTKGLNFVRRNQTECGPNGVVTDNSCVFIVNGKTPTVHFKKKCVHKRTGKDIAFKLGKGFLSYTGGIVPQFTIVAIPFVSGKLDLSKAIRTPKFEVWSKRQERHTARTNKRHKKSSEIGKLDTNIAEAEIALNALKTEFQRIRCRNRKLEVTIGTIRRRAVSLPEGASKISYEYATREITDRSETADI
jgi:hypothetical protein